jgi:D-3-phosphoglycerate dehydrogenase
LPLCGQVVQSGNWRRRYEIETGDLADHTLGIIGLGRIGSHLARLAQPFGTTVLGYDPGIVPQEALSMNVTLVGLAELLQRSDYVSIHVPLNDETRGMINRERIASMKRGAILINTARGAVMENLDVLADALESGQLSGVGLDVFPTEPPDHSHRIFKHSCCICAPHVVGTSKLAMERIYRSMANDMVAVIQGRTPTFCVNPEVFE